MNYYLKYNTTSSECTHFVRQVIEDKNMSLCITKIVTNLTRSASKIIYHTWKVKFGFDVNYDNKDYIDKDSSCYLCQTLPNETLLD